MINGSRVKNDQNPDIPVLAKADSYIAKQLKDQIEIDFRRKLAPKEHAESPNISAKAQAKASKKFFNKTLTSLIAERRIIEAKRELYLADKTIQGISLELGHKDEFYFSRFFKKNTSISPSTFRKTVGFNKGGEVGHNK